MAIPTFDLYVKAAYDNAARSLNATVQYPDEGDMVMLKCECHDNDMLASMSSLFRKCGEIKHGRGDMIPLKIWLTLNSPQFENEFRALQHDERNEILQMGDPDITTDEKLSTEIPELYALCEKSEDKKNRNSLFLKYRKKRI
jgi:hypothetical protein